MQKKTVNSNIESQDKRLSIQFSLDGFSFCITDNNTKKSICLREYLFEKSLETPQALLEQIVTIFKQDVLLQQNFSSITAIHQNRLATLVPAEFFDKDKLNSYLDYNIKTLATDYIAFDELTQIKAKNVYVPYVNINNYLFQHFGTFKYKHHASVLIEKCVAYSQADKDPLFFVHVSKKQLDIVVTQNKKLLFYNAFSVESKFDFSYYILFTIEQLELDGKVFTLLFSGDVKKESEIYKITYQYVNKVGFVETTAELFENSTDFSNHAHFILV